METQVDPAALDVAARECDDLSQRLITQAQKVEAPTAAAVTGLGAGFAMRDALQRVSASRSDEFTKFGRYLAELGDSLSSAARDYRSTDEVTADRFNNLREG